MKNKLQLWWFKIRWFFTELKLNYLYQKYQKALKEYEKMSKM